MVPSDPWAATGIREGDVLAGKYRAERVLGVGGMGVVVAARHLQLEERVAIKFLLPHLFADQGAVSRFLREARAAVKIKSEHVARVFDVGTLPNGAPYIVMEFLEGGDLTAWLEARGAMRIDQAVDFVLQACVALADAHKVGIVHRDLKPSNLFCVQRSDGQLTIKILDFGISKVTDVSGSDPRMSVTKTSAVMGSPLYMSPEQMRSSKDVDLKTDIWALGIILFELLAGKTPFDGESLPEVAVKVSIEPPPPLRSVRPDAPAALESVVTRCLEKDPRNRYPNVGELAVSLAPFGSGQARGYVERSLAILGGRSASAPPAALAPNAVSASSPEVQTAAPLGRTANERPNHRKAVAGIAGTLGIAVLVVGGVLVTRRSFDGSLRPTPTAARPSSDPHAAAQGGSTTSGSQAAPATTKTAPVDPSLPSTALPSLTPLPTGANVATTTKTLPPMHHLGKPDAGTSGTNAGAPTASPTPTSATPNCNPPYFIDPAGHKQYKPECL